MTCIRFKFGPSRMSVPRPRRCEDRFATDSSFAVVTNQLSRMKCLRGCHYPLATLVKQASYVMYVRRADVLLELMDEAILRLQNGNVIETELLFETRKGRHNNAHKEKKRHGRPGGSHGLFESWVMDPLCLHLVGLLVAGLAFSAEIVWHRLAMNRGVNN